MCAREVSPGDVGLWQAPAHLSIGSAPSARQAVRQDVVDVLIRDLRALIATVDRAGTAPPPEGEAEVERFDRFVLGLAAHLVVEDLVVRPIITSVLEREPLIEERKADIDLIVRRLARARRLGSAERFANRIRQVRVDLAEHAQLTEIGLLAHAYRVYDAEARRDLADRHPQAIARILEGARREHGAVVPWDRDLDRPLLTWLEEIARDALDIDRLAAPSATKAVPPGATRGPNGPSVRRRAKPAVEPRSSDHGLDLGSEPNDPRWPLKRPEQP
jgi:hypothetical protein